MAAVSAGLTIVGSIVPHAGFILFCAVVPFGVVSYRHRLRALLAAVVAAGVVSALVIGIGSAVGLGLCALVGGYVGVLKRRDGGPLAVAVSAAVLAPALAGVAVLVLWIFAAYRKLVLASLLSSFRGVARVLSHLGPLAPVGHSIQRGSTTAIVHWPITTAALVLIALPIFLSSAWVLIGEVIERLTWVRSANPYPVEPPGDAEPAPVPVRLRDVTVRYGAISALAGLDLELAVGEFVAIVGDNGSGKSTLARLLAGAVPDAGTVERDGPVGLGRPGGTALILQRPDAQVVGLRVRDDVLWGLPAGVDGVDVEALLATVGLAGMSERDTATLSGGELQRLAVASALARRPRLLISDESTAMVDPSGRRELVAVLAQLPRQWPMTVVHVTHNRDELAAADRIVRLERGRVAEPDLAEPDLAEPELAASVGAGAPAVVAGPEPLTVAASGTDSVRAPDSVRPPDLVSPTALSALATAPALELTELGHSYGYGTPWEHRALESVSLTVQAGEGVMIVGDNGSGKSTLAWIVAGLLAPTVGACLVRGEPAQRRRGVAAPIAFQHARLQLQRPLVGEDIADAAGWLVQAEGRIAHLAALKGTLRPRVAAAMAAVGLDPELADRSIEQLSGGQQRRVAIAGLLAREPRVLVLDEPLAGLDTPTRSGLVELLRELRARDGLTLLVVTHDPEMLMGVCPRTVTLADGRLLSDSAESVPARPLVGGTV